MNTTREVFLAFAVAIVLSAGPVAAQPFSSSNLPIVVLQVGVPIPNEPKVDGWMGVIDHPAGVRNRVGDAYDGYDGPIGIEIRGSSSQSFPKKSYAVELRGPDGLDVEASVLGMPADEDWILYGPYSDKSFLRNALIMHLARSAGRYASRTRFVELVLNGSYEGVYVLMERIKRGDDRVDVARLDPTEVTGDDVTGGYILKIDKWDGAEIGGWWSGYPPFPGSGDRVFVQYHYPRPNEIAPEQQAYIQEAYRQFEALMASASYADPVVGYPSLLDVESAVDFVLLNEISKNIDGYRLSTFLSRDRVQAGEPPPKFVLGPIWDFNLGFGNANYYEGERTAGWQIEVRLGAGEFHPPFWFRKLWDDRDFHFRVVERWSTLRSGPWHDESIRAWIDANAAFLSEAGVRDAARWGNLGTWVWPNPVVWSTRTQEINYLKDWITLRLAWMDSRIRWVTGVEDGPSVQSGGWALDIYPNPASGVMTVRAAGPRSGGGSPHGAATVTVADLLGRTRSSVVVREPGFGPFETPVDVSGLEPGVYFVRVSGGDHEGARAFVVAR